MKYYINKAVQRN